MALIALVRFEEALDCCNRCLEYDSNNSDMANLRQKVLAMKESHDRKVQEKQEHIRKENEEKRRLQEAFKVNLPIELRHVLIGLSRPVTLSFATAPMVLWKIHILPGSIQKIRERRR